MAQLVMLVSLNGVVGVGLSPDRAQLGLLYFSTICSRLDLGRD